MYIKAQGTSKSNAQACVYFISLLLMDNIFDLTLRAYNSATLNLTFNENIHECTFAKTAMPICNKNVTKIACCGLTL